MRKIRLKRNISIDNFYYSGHVAVAERYDKGHKIHFESGATFFVPPHKREDVFESFYNGNYHRPMSPYLALESCDGEFNVSPTFIESRITDKTLEYHRKRIGDVIDLVCEYNAFIAGSYAAFVAMDAVFGVGDSEPNDIDIYFPDESSLIPFISRLVACDFRVVFINPISIVLKRGDDEDEDNETTVNLIVPQKMRVGATYGLPEDVIDTFDFSVARAAWDGKHRVIVDEHFFDDYNNKVLRLMRVNNPLSAMYRIEKYAKKGFRAPSYLYWILHTAIDQMKENLPKEYANLQKYSKLSRVAYKSLMSTYPDDYVSFPGIIDADNIIIELASYVHDREVRDIREAIKLLERSGSNHLPYRKYDYDDLDDFTYGGYLSELSFLSREDQAKMLNWRIDLRRE